MPTTKLCLILAAGNGHRLASRSGEFPKPLVMLHGRPLLEHVMRGACMVGIRKFVIVIGYHGQLIKEWYESHHLDGIQVTWIENSEYHKDNGISVLQAKYAIRENFLLLMADHIFESNTAKSFLLQAPQRDEVILAVDRNLDRVFDLEDATKVKIEQNHIVNIGKDLRQYNALDTGMFQCSPMLFDRLEEATINGNCSLSDGLRLMAANRKFKAFDIGNALWQDVDTPAALDHATRIFSAPRRDFNINDRLTYA